MIKRGWIQAGVAGIFLGGFAVSQAPLAQHAKAQEACVHPEKVATREEAEKWFPKDPKTGKIPLGLYNACFAPGTPDDKVESFHAALEREVFSQGAEYITSGSRWQTSGNANGSPSIVTWSFVPDGLVISQSGTSTGPAAPSTLFATLDAQFASSGGRAKWKSIFQAMFDRWSSLCGIKYVYVKSGTNDWDSGQSWGTAGNDTTFGDVRISMRPIDGNYNILAFNFYPSNGDMVMDAGEDWTQWANNKFLRNTISHEHGHGMGMPHNCPKDTTKLMEPTLTQNFDGPRQDEIRHAQHLYGDILEPNETLSTVLAAAATTTISANGSQTLGNVPVDPLAAVGSEPSNSSTLSLHSNGPDVDFIKFTLTTARTVQLTATPIGSTYPQVAQATDGSCAAGTNIDTLALADLRLSLINASSATLQAINNFPAGSAESTSSVTLAAGNYVAKIDSVTGVPSTQLYKLGFTATAARELRGRLTVDSVGAFYPGETVRAIFTPAIGTEVIFTSTLATNGDYAFPLTNLPGGSYTLRIDGPNSVIQGTGSLSIIDGIMTVNRSCVNGDVNNDGEVGPTDFDLVVSNFGQPFSNPSQGDLDRDGEIGPGDFDVVVRNFGIGDQ